VDDKTGCPFCSGRQETDSNNLAVSYPKIADEWHPLRNGDLTPWSVVPGSLRTIWWRCRKDRAHVWCARPVSRTRMGSGCPICAETIKGKTRTKLSKTNSLAKLFPELGAQWHVTKNGPLKATQVTPGSNRAVWWKCSIGADHVWLAKINDRTRAKTGCPFCANKRASKTNNFARTHSALAKEWHPSKNGDLCPSQIPGNGRKRLVWWQCPANKRHAWQTTIDKRIRRAHIANRLLRILIGQTEVSHQLRSPLDLSRKAASPVYVFPNSRSRSDLVMLIHIEFGRVRLEKSAFALALIRPVHDSFSIDLSSEAHKC
jgi:hypothetical protein